MEALPTVTSGHHLDHTAKLPSVLGGVPRRQDAHRVDVIRIKFGGKGRRPIVRDREAVDDVLNLVLGTTGMQDAVGFQ